MFKSRLSLSLITLGLLASAPVFAEAQARAVHAKVVPVKGEQEPGATFVSTKFGGSIFEGGSPDEIGQPNIRAQAAASIQVDILPSLRSCGSDFSCFAKRNGGASTLPRSRPRPGARPVPLTPT